MKKCPYCGKAYPNEAVVCAVDGEALSPEAKREKVTGIWRGIYGYGTRTKLPERTPVAFTLKLKQGWTKHFTGSAQEDLPQGVPGTGVVDGYFNSSTLEFTKQMPVGYITEPDGTRVTLREYIIAQGGKCDRDLPSPPIFYQGTFLDPNRVQGVWIINPRQMSAPDGLSFSTARSAGFWCMEFVTTDTNVIPTGGPTEPLFDKSLLSPRELANVETSGLQSLGKFNVTDTAKILDQFESENIWFEINRNDAGAQTSPAASYTGGHSGTAKVMEIFVQLEDIDRAQAIIQKDYQV